MAKTIQAQVVGLQPMLERTSQSAVPVSRRLPRVVGGICETCGVLDKHRKSEEQYTLCPHFRTFGLLRCSYCEETKNPMDVIRMSDISVAEHPEQPGKYIAWCDSFECSKKHEKRFNKSLS